MTESDRDTLIRHYHSNGEIDRLLKLADPKLGRSEQLIIGKQLSDQMETVYESRDLAKPVVFPNGVCIEACPVPNQRLLSEYPYLLPFAVGINSSWGLMSSKLAGLGSGNPDSFYNSNHSSVRVPFKPTVVHSTSSGLTQTIEINQRDIQMVERGFSDYVYGTILITEEYTGIKIPDNADIVGPFWETDRHLVSLGILNQMDEQLSNPVLDWFMHISGSLFKGLLRGKSTRSGLVFMNQVYTG